MPKQIYSQNEITQCVKDRAILEVELCKKLYGIYNKAPILQQVQETLAFAFENVAALVLLPDRGPAKAKQEAVKEGKILKVFTKHGGGKPSVADLGAKCTSVIKKWKSWDAADCSDISRLIGSVLEKAGSAHKQFDQERGTYKPDEFYANDPKKAGRSREFVKSYLGNKGLSPELNPTSAGRNAGLLAKFQPDDISGISPFRLMPYSTVRKIDIAFGLPEGADISGTTSDSIIVNQMTAKFCKEIKIGTTAEDKLLQLLPLVTMISHGHHTLLESAMTLTLFGFCKYQIGFYTTLVSGPDGKTQVGGEILKELKNAETDKKNRHLLCFLHTGNGRYMAYEFTTPDEIKQYRKFATCGEGLLKYFRDSVSTCVYERDIKPLMDGRYFDVKRVYI